MKRSTVGMDGSLGWRFCVTIQVTHEPGQVLEPEEIVRLG
jgi:hypothetical protein